MTKCSLLYMVNENYALGRSLASVGIMEQLPKAQANLSARKFMRQFRADLHIHSRYSRATSKKLTLPLLAAWAKAKGIDVLATGDITHPGWRDEIKTTLELDDNSGLYCLKQDIKLSEVLPQFAERMIPPAPQFMLQGEISSIYKRDGKVRKVHNLVFFPTLEAAEHFSTRLAQVGNLLSDGRPILGLDCQDLLSMVLDTHPEAFLIPAHVWTPWFSVFGSKSGFDSLEECFGDLSKEIFALETGLSSDPAMNWTWSALDRYTLISNSDAHSGENLAREANLFSGQPSYLGILAGLRKQADAECKFQGTIEFFPEEGKYHTDGHRTCKVSLTPKETQELAGICPVCGNPVTEGVASRVLALADRDEPIKPEDAANFYSLIPLAEILGEISKCGTKSKKVVRQHASLILRYGSELSVLMDTPTSELARFSAPLGEAISRMRSGKVTRIAGYDGEYGRIKLFSKEEASELHQDSRLLPSLTLNKKAVREARNTSPSQFSKEHKKTLPVPEEVVKDKTPILQPDKVSTVNFNPEQQVAIEAGPGPILVMAGPGTGKTRTLVGRIEYLVAKGVRPKKILAITFTRRAALEMDKRLRLVLDHLPTTDTMHAIAFALWHKVLDTPVLLSEEDARRTFAEANPDYTSSELKKAWQAVALSREQMQPCPEDFFDMHNAYFSHKGSWNLVDYTDLLEFWLEQIDNGLFTPPWEHVLVDEVQDLSALQLALIKGLLEKRREPNSAPDSAPGLESHAEINDSLSFDDSNSKGTSDKPKNSREEPLSLDGLDLDEYGSDSSIALPTLSTSTGNGFFGIGDPNQAIYSFRGAYGQVEEYFKVLWPHLQTLHLTANYRSGANILNAAFTVLKGKKALQENPAFDETAPKAATSTPSEVRLFEASGAGSEAIWVADRILDLLAPTSHSLADAKAQSAKQSKLSKGLEVAPGDIVILVRLSSLAKRLAEVLEKDGIPVSIPEEDTFWADDRVKMILHAAGLFLGIAPESEEEPLACPDRMIAKGPLGVAAYLSEIPPFDRLFWQSHAFKALNRAFDNYEGWAGLINWINLQNELEVVREQAEKVQIMTMHASKGLEFPFVFVAGLEDGLMPFAGPNFLSGHISRDENMNIDEEKRLLYVAMTRAERGLYLSFALKRKIFGKELRLPKSRFLEALPESMLIHSKGFKRIRHKTEQLSLI